MSHFFQTAYKELPETVYALLVLIVIDYVTGVCLAVKEKTASSKVGAKGIASKVLIVCLVATGLDCPFHENFVTFWRI